MGFGRRLLGAMAFLLPLVFFLKAYDGVSVKTALFQSGAWGLAVWWLAKGAYRGRYETPQAAMGLLLPAGGLAAWLVLGWLIAPGKEACFQEALLQVLYVGVFAVAVLEFGGLAEARDLIAWTLRACWIVCLYGACQRLGWDPFAWKGAFGARVFSTLGGPEALAQFLAAGVPLALARGLDPERGRGERVGDGLLVLACAMNMLWTQSGHGWLALAASFAAFAPAAWKFAPSSGGRRLAAWSGAAAAGALFLALARPAARESLVEHRLIQAQAWDGAVRLAAESPLQGRGPGSFSSRYTQVRRPEIGRDAHWVILDHPDNVLLKVAAESGLVGAVLWIWLGAAVLWSAWRAGGVMAARGASSHAACAAGLFAAVLGGAASGLIGTGTLYSRGPESWLRWTMAGILGGLAISVRGTGVARVLPMPWARPPLWLRAAAFCLAAGAVVPALWLWSDVEHNIGVRHSRRGEWEPAIAAYSRVSRGSYAGIAALYFKANALRLLERHEEAVLAFAQVESLWPDFSWIHYPKGLAHVRLGDWEGAAVEFARHARLFPSHQDNLLRWTEAELARGDSAGARRAAFRAVGAAPADPKSWQGLAMVYMKERRQKDLRAVRERMVRLGKARGGGR